MSGETLHLSAREIVDTTAPYELVSKMRASFWVIGPLLARMGQARVSMPGGCAIGTRPVDLLIMALERLGANVEIEAGYVHANLSWGEKCLRSGQYCKIRGDREYHRYRFHCHTGRLSRSASGGNQSGSGCQAGYSPCLPRVVDLNCSDIPESKKPIRVTGSDPYRLDGDGDGWGCEP